MNKEKNTANKISNLSEKPPITSPIFQDKLVSKVNELTFKNCISSIGHGASKTFNNEKGLTLNYKFVVDELIKITEITNLNELYLRIYSIISQNIDSDFIAAGLYKEKSNCINLRLCDKYGNSYTTKVFLKDSDNPIVDSFKNKKTPAKIRNPYLHVGI